MQCHLSAAESKRDGRACTCNNFAACRFEHGLDASPLDVSIDRIGQHSRQSLAVGSVHGCDDSTSYMQCKHLAGGARTPGSSRAEVEI